MGGKSVN